MNARRSRRFLILAFALSLLVHIMVASGLRWPELMRPQDQIEVVRVERLRRTTIHRVPTPQPQTPTPQKTPAAATVAARPSGKSPGTGKPATQPQLPQAAAPTLPPSPVPTLSAAPCTKGDVAVAIAVSPSPPDIPVSARGAATNAIARVRVTLDAAGAIQKTLVVGSTGNPSLDLAAVAMARSAQYAPALHDCKPIAADYTFAVRFAPW
ncbi:MAG: TonB family protein [Candidatus Eremiobacteraeota bacterium]|nr:TonB family protein [Candidatus Eremiobacteraeota bacterium]